MSKEASRHEHEQKITMIYIDQLKPEYAKYLDDPWTNDFHAFVQRLIEEKPKHKKMIKAAEKFIVMRGPL